MASSDPSSSLNPSLPQPVPREDDLPSEIAWGLRSSSMRALIVRARRAAAAGSTILVTGESGVGKERLARFIHDVSPRRLYPFVAVNCGGLPDTLLESELFGHARGAFTGATSDKKGLFEAAAAGTLFLDEIGEMRIDMQVKLLRVLQDHEVRRLGEIRARHVDVRVIAATHRALHIDVTRHRFREDLFYRLAVITFHIPPLRDRHDDLCSLIDHLLHTLARRFGRPFRLSARARDFLLAYAWPGNIRELENVFESACALASDDTIDLHDLPESVRDPQPRINPSDARVRPLREVERDYILFALRKNGGNRTLTARQLGIGTKTLYRKLLQYRIPDTSDVSLTGDVRSD